MEQLSVLPDSGEISAEWTSRDRSSDYNAATDKYMNWSANGDGAGFMRTNDDGGKIIAEMTGPGCIWRIWGGSESGAHVKIFLDGSTTPVIDLAWRDYFNHSQTPFNYASLVYNLRVGLINNTSAGLNSFVVRNAKRHSTLEYSDSENNENRPIMQRMWSYLRF
ncbi:MAG: hypothetical protein PF489_11075 [Salinivirgaceae bacterium]|nr:hypothetical protein [Salinivirgaceae bacterium]